MRNILKRSEAELMDIEFNKSVEDEDYIFDIGSGEFLLPEILDYLNHVLTESD